MRRLATLGMLVAMLGLAVGCGKKDNSSASGGGGGGTGIEGTYTLVSMEVMGQTMPEDTKKPEAERTIKITGDKLIANKGGKEDPASYKTDTTKTPNEIDVTSKKDNGKEEKMYGIYKVDGDKLILCMALSDKAADRPKEFKTGGDAKALTMMMTLQKK